MASLADPPLYDLVVVGSSAGGIEALARLVATLPEAFPAPVVLAQHLDPTRPSRLSEILTRRTRLSVRVVEEGASQPLWPATIYVVPADRDVEITDNAVRLRDGALKHPKPSVDLLLSSAARAHGERTIAVILTGTGSDGAAGAREVKAAGGMVIIENPETAAYPSMPASLAPTTVDLAVDLDRIGPLLYELLTGTYSLPSPTVEPDGSLDALLSAIEDRSGIDFTRYKQATILRRIQRRMAATGMHSLRDYASYVERHPDEYSRLASSFLVKVTEFFRDQDFYTYLREQIIPKLIAYARAHGNRLRIWSAGCATGEEAYSVAMLIAEQFGSELNRFTVHIFATDADAAAITFARRGVYPAAALARVPAAYRGRYFTAVDGGYAIDRRIRSLVIFGEHDLGKRAPFPEIDLVLCRNVLIYFTPEMQRRALQLFAFSLRHTGYLVLGTSESAAALPEYFAAIERRLRVYRRQGGRVLVGSLPQHVLPRLLASSPGAAAAPLGLAPQTHEAREPREPETLVPVGGPAARPGFQSVREKLGDQILGLPGVGVVVVDPSYDVQVINGAAYTLLGIIHAAQGKDLLHLAERVPTKPLRAAIDAALRAAPPQECEATVTLERGDGESRRLRIVCYPHAPPATDIDQERENPAGAVDAVLLLITDVTGEQPHAPEAADEHAAVIAGTAATASTGAARRGGRRRTQPLPRSQQGSEIERVTQELERERAQAGMRELRAANQELRDANQELLRDNDALMLREEEAQAAMEQARTLNEEQQTVNEELETLNDEMEATLEQLRTTNDDLRARSHELEELVRERETQRQESERERARLAAILADMSDALFVVDANGTVVLTNPAYDQLLGASPAPVLEDVDGAPLPAEATPQRRALEGAPFTMECGLVSYDGTRRRLEARGEPIRGKGDTFAGAVVAIRDITERSALALQEQFLTMVSHEMGNLLVPPRATLQLLVRKLGGKEANGSVLTQRLAVRALHGVELLGALVNDLSDLARTRHGKLVLQHRLVDLAALTRQAVDDLNVVDIASAGAASEKAPRIQFQLVAETAGPVWINADPKRIEQILHNVLTNALTHTPAPGHVRVSLERQEACAELRVQDEGPGIAAAARPYVFTPYFQAAVDQESREHRGLGLGLFIVAELVKAHGGSIRAESPPTGGALFVLSFPLEASGAQPSEPERAEQEHVIVPAAADHERE